MTTNKAIPTRTTWGSPWAWTLATIGVSCLLVLSLLLPAHLTTSVERPHSIVFTFDTSAPGTEGDPIYGAAGARFGDPIFLALSDRLIVSVAVEPDTVEHLELDAQLTSSVGWTQPVATATTATSTGTATGTGTGTDTNVTNEAELTLDLPQLITLIDATETRTGTVGNQTVLITATALSTPAATDGVSLHSSAPLEPITSVATVEFSISPTTISLSGPSLVPGDDPDAAAVAGRHEAVTMIPAETSNPRYVGLGAARLPVPQLRILLGAGTTVLAAIALRSAIIALRARRRGEEAWLRARYAAHLVPAHPVQPEHLQHIEVESFATLLRLSGQLHQSILVADETSSDPNTISAAPDSNDASTLPGPTVRQYHGSRFCVVDGLTAFTYTTPPRPARATTTAGRQR